MYVKGIANKLNASLTMKLNWSLSLIKVNLIFFWPFNIKPKIRLIFYMQLYSSF